MWTMLFVVSAVATMLTGHVGEDAKPALKPGTYFFSYYSDPVAELRVGIIKVEEKDGKLTASVQDGGRDKTYLHEFAADGGRVSATITFGARPKDAPRLRFEGLVDPKNPNRIAGDLQASSSSERVYAATLVATDQQRFASQAEHIVRLKVPVELHTAEALNYGRNPLREQANKTDDLDQKKKLLAAAKELDGRKDQEIPRLLRKVIEEHPDTPAAVHAAGLLLERAGRINASPDETKTWAKAVGKYAEGYGPRLVAFTALQTAEALAGHETLAPIALPFAEQAVAASPQPRLQLRALNALGLAEEKVGRADDAARTRSWAEQLRREMEKKK